MTTKTCNILGNVGISSCRKQQHFQFSSQFRTRGGITPSLSFPSHHTQAPTPFSSEFHGARWKIKSTEDGSSFFVHCCSRKPQFSGRGGDRASPPPARPQQPRTRGSTPSTSASVTPGLTSVNTRTKILLLQSAFCVALGASKSKQLVPQCIMPPGPRLPMWISVCSQYQVFKKPLKKWHLLLSHPMG